MKSKLKFIIPIVLIALGGAYKFVLAPSAPAEKPPPPKVKGEVYVLPKDFLLNIKGGGFAKFGVGLVLGEGQATASEAGGGEGSAAPKPPDGYGTLPQEAVIRAIITDQVTGVSSGELESSDGRARLKRLILKRIKAETDVKVEDILITDLAVQ